MMKKYILFLYTLLIFTFSCQSEERTLPSESTNKSALAARIDSVAEHFFQTGEMAGFSIAVLRGEDTLYAKGFGYSDLEQKKPVTASTVFPDGGRSDYGLGFRQGTFQGRRVWGHTGGHMTFWSTLAFYPETETSIAVFGNTDGASVDALLLEGEVALAVFGEKEPDLESLKKDADLSVYVGEYAKQEEAYSHDDLLLMRTYEDDPGYLYRTRKGSDSKGGRLLYLGDHTFAPEKFPMDRMVFEVKEGQVSGFREYYNGLYMQRRSKL